MEAELLDMDAVEVDRPPAGTACVACKAALHFCSAREYRGDEPVCLWCADGVHIWRGLARKFRVILLLAQGKEITAILTMDF